MKSIRILVVTMSVALLVITVLLYGCDTKDLPAVDTQNAESVLPSGEPGVPAANELLNDVIRDGISTPDNWDSMTPDEQEEWAMSMIMGGGKWDKDSLPDDMPEFKDCTVIASGGSPEEYIIKAEAESAAAKAYYAELENAGYEVTETGDDCTAAKGGVTIDIVKQSDILYQISVRAAKAGEWLDTIPDYITPPKGKQLLNDVFYNDTSDGSGTLFNGGFTVVDMTEAEAEAYLTDLAKTWNEGEYSGWELFGKAEESGKLWDVQLSIYDTAGGTVQFVINVALAE